MWHINLCTDLWKQSSPGGRKNNAKKHGNKHDAGGGKAPSGLTTVCQSGSLPYGLSTLLSQVSYSYTQGQIL
jgi:hypothetical protein